MKKYLFLMAALLMVAMACQKNETNSALEDTEEGWGYITARLDETLTKGILEDVDGDTNLDFKWEQGDKIRLKVNKGTLESPNYAWRNGYIFSVDTGNHSVVIKYDKGTGTNIAKYVLGAWYPWKADENAEPTAVRTEQDYSIGKVSIPLHATNVSDESPIDVGDNASTDIALDQELVFAPYNPGGTGYSVVGYRIKKEEGDLDRTITSIKVNNGSTDYTLSNINAALTTDVQTFYIVLPASEDAIANFKVTIQSTDTGNLTYSYSRTKSTYTPVANKVTRMPVISDLVDTGKIRILLGTSANVYPGGLPYSSILRANPFTALTDADTEADAPGITAYLGYVTLTLSTNPSSSKYRGDFAPIFYGSNHVYYGLYDAGAKYFRTKSDAERLTVHAGKYPIVAVKMSNLDKTLRHTNSATAYNFKFDVNSKSGENDNHTYTGSGSYAWHSSRVIGTQSTSATSYSDGDDTLVYWFDLSSDNYKVDGNTGNHFPNAAVNLYSLCFVLADIAGPSSAPNVNVYWIGTFKDTSELNAFIANPTI